MVPLTELWMPIIGSAVLVFIASAIFWMVLPFHRNDYRRAPNEDALLSVIRSGGFKAGQYGFPMPPSHKECSSPEFKERYAKGPWGMLLMRDSPCNMGSTLGLWFVYIVLVATLTAYLTGLNVSAGAAYMTVFRMAAATSAMAFVIAQLPASIWGGKPWNNTLKDMIDGVIYSLLTAGVFGWLWPEAAAAVSLG